MGSHKRYKEHSHDFKFNIHKSSFAAQLLDNNHSMGPTHKIMEVLYTTRNCWLMDTVERFHSYSETRKNNQINDKNTIKPNAIFNIICPHDPPQNVHWLASIKIQVIHSQLPQPAMHTSRGTIM
jgi:hypothetical protein